MVNSNERNVREMLLNLKVPSYLVDMAIPYMWMLPGTTDPDAQPVIEIIRAVQRGLIRLGSKLPVTGVLDAKTARAIDEISGTNWMQKTWIQICGDIIAAIANPMRTAHKMKYTPRPAVGSYYSLGDVLDAGTTLKFGPSKSDPNLILAIPKNYGTTYQAFANLQRQINRILTAKNTRIAEDGMIGSETYKGLQAAQDVIGMSVAGDESTGTMAAHAVSIANVLKYEADSRGISASANPGDKVTPKSANAAPAVAAMTAAQAATFTGGGSGGAMDALKKYLPYLLIAGGVAFFAAKNKKKRRKR